MKRKAVGPKTDGRKRRATEDPRPGIVGTRLKVPGKIFGVHGEWYWATVVRPTKGSKFKHALDVRFDDDHRT